MEKLLFTGGTGFLGTNVKPILDKSYEVTTIGITDRDMIKANLVTGVPELPEHYDVVLHAAGKAHIYPKTETEIKAFYDVNYEGTVNLCKALEKVGLPKSFIFISTLDVYGLAVGEGIDETYPKNPTTHYAISKLQAEEYLIKWAEEKGVILGILRPRSLLSHCHHCRDYRNKGLWYFLHLLLGFVDYHCCHCHHCRLKLKAPHRQQQSKNGFQFA